MKFKVYDTKEKKWAENLALFMVNSDGVLFVWDPSSGNYYADSGRYKYVEFTEGMDKDGNMIYEGHIVIDPQGKYWQVINMICQYGFEEGGTIGKLSIPATRSSFNDTKIVGHIFTDEHLLM